MFSPLVIPVVADTIRLKDGSVIRGQVVGFKDQQFTVLIGSGAQGRRSRTLIYVEDIESIEFDSATTSAAATLANEDAPVASNNTPDYQPPRTNQPAETTGASSNQYQPAYNRKRADVLYHQGIGARGQRQQRLDKQRPGGP